MTQGFRERLQKGLIKYGRPEVVRKVVKSTGRQKRTIDRWIKDGAPDSHGVFSIALACGANEEEAFALARECFPLETDKTA